MDDYELNKAIAEALNIFKSDDGFGRVRVWDSGMQLDGESKDYCNNWNDLMPLVMESSLDFEWSEAGLTVTYFDFESMTFNEEFKPVKKPQRAIAECLLLTLTNHKEYRE